jgi:acyl-coenzyme A thioesterase 9
MDLDGLSGVVTYKHTGEGVTTVTAAVDRINIKNPLTEICDLEMSGQVTYATGRSSMDITLQIAKASTSPSATLDLSSVFITCALTMVSLDPSTKKPVSIAPLEITTPSERALYARGEANHAARRPFAPQTSSPFRLMPRNPSLYTKC